MAMPETIPVRVFSRDLGQRLHGLHLNAFSIAAELSHLTVNLVSQRFLPSTTSQQEKFNMINESVLTTLNPRIHDLPFGQALPDIALASFITSAAIMAFALTDEVGQRAVFPIVDLPAGQPNPSLAPYIAFHLPTEGSNHLAMVRQALVESIEEAEQSTRPTRRGLTRNTRLLVQTAARDFIQTLFQNESATREHPFLEQAIEVAATEAGTY